MRAGFGVCSGSSAAMKRRGRGAEEEKEACGVWLDAAALKRRKVQVGAAGDAGECGGRLGFLQGFGGASEQLGAGLPSGPRNFQATRICCFQTDPPPRWERKWATTGETFGETETAGWNSA